MYCAQGSNSIQILQSRRPFESQFQVSVFKGGTLVFWEFQGSMKRPKGKYATFALLFFVVGSATAAIQQTPFLARVDARITQWGQNISGERLLIMYTKSLVNTNSFYTNFTNTHFQKVPIPHLTRTMKQKFLH